MPVSTHFTRLSAPSTMSEVVQQHDVQSTLCAVVNLFYPSLHSLLDRQSRRHRQRFVQLLQAQPPQRRASPAFAVTRHITFLRTLNGVG